MRSLKPFWRYYGGKWRAAPRYPAPRYGTIVEPFAGAAGYSLRYYDRNVVLVEKHPVIAELWRYLIGVSRAEIERIPYAKHVDDLPGWVPAGGRALVGFAMNNATTTPRKSLSKGLRQLNEQGRHYGWAKEMRDRVASQVDCIRHWQIIEGDYLLAPSLIATWFYDAPYQGEKGRLYPHGSRSLDYAQVGSHARAQQGQVIVCEAEGATWLPFRPFGTIKAGPARRVSREVIWTNDDMQEVAA